MNYSIGDKVGGYEVTGVLGAGGMGEIYAVRNVISDRAEAMKVLLSDLRAEAELAERFIREIKLQARLRHANIAGLHTAFEADGQLVMIMELIEGKTLSDLLASNALGIAEAVDYTLQSLSALDYAHSQGVVHRDIKPSNIMVAAEGTVKLMDFGIAKAMTDKSLTRTGNLIGSLHYMSPEQVRGDSGIDGRTDIYSLGVVVYEMVTGRKPFDGNSEFSIMRAHLEEPPVPPEDIDASIAPGLSEVILTALAKDREERYQTAGDFLAALERFRETSAPRPSAAPPVREVEAPVTPPLARSIDPEITGYQRPAAGKEVRHPEPSRPASARPPASRSVPDQTTVSGQIDPQITGYMRRPEPPPAPAAGDSGRRQSSGSRSRLRTISGERAALRDTPQAPPEPAVRRMFPKVAIGAGIAAALALGFLIPGWLSNDSLDGEKMAVVTESTTLRPESAGAGTETGVGARQPTTVTPEPRRVPPDSTRRDTPPPASSRSVTPTAPRSVVESPGSRSAAPEPTPASPAPAPPSAAPPAAATPASPPVSEPITQTPPSPSPVTVAPSSQPDPPAQPAVPRRSTPPPSVTPDADRVYTIKEPGVSPPQMTHQVQPQYTAAARTKRVQGRVILEAEVWQDGLAHNIRVLQSVGDAGLDQNATTALRKWRFAPGVKDGQPVKVRIAVAMNFRLM